MIHFLFLICNSKLYNNSHSLSMNDYNSRSKLTFPYPKHKLKAFEQRPYKYRQSWLVGRHFFRYNCPNKAAS